MTVRYHTRKGVRVPDYQCVRENIQTAGQKCQVIQGAGVDAAISQLLLDTVTPLALEVALNVQAELEARADDADKLRRSHVERARQRAELAHRRYLAVDPDNRLVADTSRPTGTTRCVVCKPPRTSTSDRPPPPKPRSPNSTSSASANSPQTSQGSGTTRPPRRASASASPGC